MAKRPQLDTYWNRKSFADKFWAQVDVRGPDECWPWRGGLMASGYGSAYCPLASFLGAHAAHRVAYFLTFGDPGKRRVRHACDARSCCNPDHCFVAVPTTGAREKLKPLQVREVRDLLACGVTPKNVAYSHGLHPSTVRRIRSGETWKFVA
jgi:hypothetical protein